jgi:membrane protein implicated in regulation of membrane protease activity
MSESTLWWVLAGAAVAIELATGTFYLLMMALGLAAGAVAAHLGASTTVQLLAAALVGCGAVVAWHTVRGRGPRELPTASNPDINMDVGETVQVDAWQPDGSSQVRYRGAQWTVVQAPGGTGTVGAHRISEVVGSKLVVEKI